jgi:hypothetical protein
MARLLQVEYESSPWGWDLKIWKSASIPGSGQLPTRANLPDPEKRNFRY